VLSFVFIALAALLKTEVLLEFVVPKLLVVAAVALLIRPALVFVSTVGDRFTLPERVFMSAVGPRGIIPASVATLFAVELRTQATELEAEATAATGTEAADLSSQAALLATQADILVGTVFLVILLTVVLEGGFARHIAEYLDVIPMRVIIVGGGTVGRSLATRLEDRGENVVLIEENIEEIERARNDGFAVEAGDGTDTDVLRSAGAENAKTIVAATGDDDVNLLVAQLASATFDTQDVITRVNNPNNVDAFEDLGVRAIDSPMATAWAIDNQIERPALTHWMTDRDRDGDVQEVEVRSDEFADRSVDGVRSTLPDGCLLALVSRDGETTIPTADDVVRHGDKLTLLGEHDAVRDGMALCRGN
jgi:K+ transport systems, NAD-binding component